VVFTDNFQDGNSSGWVATSSTNSTPATSWRVASVGGSLALEQFISTSQTRRFMYLTTPNSDAGVTLLGNMSVQAKVRITDQSNNLSSGDGAKVCARYQVTNGSVDNVYCVALLAGATPNTGSLRILQGMNVLGTAATNLTITINTWYTLKIVVSGTTTTTISAYFEGDLITSVNDTTTPFLTGVAAVGTTGVTAAFDDVIVTTP